MKTLEDIVNKLISKTKDGSISWLPGIGSAGFKVNIGKYDVHIWVWEDEDGAKGVSVGVREKDVTTGEFVDIAAHDVYSAQYAKFYDLYWMAKRSGLKLDKIINEIDDELDSKFPF